VIRLREGRLVKHRPKKVCLVKHRPAGLSRLRLLHLQRCYHLLPKYVALYLFLSILL
jgi:hypothetical protein